MKPPLSSNSDRQAAAAFTLFEVVIGLMVLSLFVGSIFTIIQTTLRATVEVESLQREHDRQRQIIDVMRETFGSLPPGTSINLRVTESGEPPVQELEIRGAPNVFPFGGQGSSTFPTLLGLRPTSRFESQTGEPLHELSVTRSDLLGTDEDAASRGSRSVGDGPLTLDEEGRPWLPLLRDVRALQWTFYRADRREWREEWTRNTLPDLIKMELWLADRTHPLTGVFNIPRPGDAALVPEAEETEVDGSLPIDPVTGRPLAPADGPVVPAQVPEGAQVQPGNRADREGGGQGGREGRGGRGGDGGGDRGAGEGDRGTDSGETNPRGGGR